MKSTSKKKNLFSLEDFEKGLMLAGYISPYNSDELVEREILNDYENQKEEKRKSSYFKRAVLAAEITCQLHAESTFGHVKLQKLMFLCEHASNMNLNDLYLKKAAGPFDNKFMHSIDKELAKQKWFTAKRKKSNQKKCQSLTQMQNLSKLGLLNFLWNPKPNSARSFGQRANSSSVSLHPFS